MDFHEIGGAVLWVLFWAFVLSLTVDGILSLFYRLDGDEPTTEAIVVNEK